MFDTEVFVLGGGPAGLAAAIAARQAGLKVLLADAERPPIDKACGEGLMPDSLAAAAQLGIRVPPSLGFSFRGIRFLDASRMAQADFKAGMGIGVRRTVLQTLMMECAQRAGVEFLWKCPVTGIERNSVSFRRGKINARWIVGADGAQSSVRRWADLQRFRRNTHRFSYRRHYRIQPWSEWTEIHWGARCQFYVTPISQNEVCLVLVTRDPRHRIVDALPYFPALQSRLAGCEDGVSERGALAATRTLRRIARANVALIGDASGMVDPITGEGMCLAFKQAIALAEGLAQGDLSLYQRAHDCITRRPRLMADFMLLLDRSAGLRRRTLAALESRPPLFANLLAVHAGQLTPARFAAAAAAMAWGLVTA